MSASTRKHQKLAITTGKPTISRPRVSDSVTPVTHTAHATIDMQSPVSRYSASAPIRRTRAAGVRAGRDAAADTAMAKVSAPRARGSSAVPPAPRWGQPHSAQIDVARQRERGIRLREPVVELHGGRHPVHGGLAVARRLQPHAEAAVGPRLGVVLRARDVGAGYRRMALSPRGYRGQSAKRFETAAATHADRLVICAQVNRRT